jgi:hypothetical protein
MTKESERLKTLARGISEKPKTVSPKRTGLTASEANPPHGEKGDFLKVTATLSPEVYRLLADEMTRRKLAKEPNAQLSAILREAVVAYLEGRQV